MDIYTETNLQAALLKTTLDWFYGTQESVHIKVDIENPGFTSTYPMPVEYIQTDAVVAVLDESKPNETIQLSMKSIVLNINLESTDKLRYDLEGIEFQARFAGRPSSIYVPYDALIAIFNPKTTRASGNASFVPSALKRIQIDDSQQKPMETPKEEPKKNHLSVVRNLH